MIPYATTILVLLILVGAECFFPARPEKNKGRRVVFHLALSHFNLALFEILLAGSFLRAVEFGTGRRWGGLSHTDWSPALEFVVAILALDLFSYAMHRLNHGVPWFWKWHRLHHTDTAIDASSALREHFGQRLVGFPFELVALFLIGPTWETYILYKTLAASLSLFHHANLKTPIPGLGHFLVVPEFHLIHHRRGGEKLHFGSLFPWWDRIFGTFTRETFQNVPIGAAALILFFLSTVSYGGSCSTAVPLLKDPGTHLGGHFGFGALACVALAVMYFISRRSDPSQ